MLGVVSPVCTQPNCNISCAACCKETVRLDSSRSIEVNLVPSVLSNSSLAPQERREYPGNEVAIEDSLHHHERLEL